VPLLENKSRRPTRLRLLTSRCQAPNGRQLGGQRRTLNGVSTRKLIIASLVCGLLILVAGTAKLLQTANDTDSTPNLLKIGTAAVVGDITVRVNDVQVTPRRTLVNVTVSGLRGTTPLEGWSMLANGEITEPIGSADCPTAAEDVTCTIEFVPAVGTPTIVWGGNGEKWQWLGS